MSAIYRLCCYADCDWRGTVDEAVGGDPDVYEAADDEQDAHMAPTHGYPDAPMDYPAVRRVLG